MTRLRSLPSQSSFGGPAMLVVFASAVFFAGTAGAQSIATEASITAGHSTEENVSAAATQLRVFGDITPHFRFYGEAAWGNTTDEEVAAFGAAYPYSNRVQAIDAYVETIVRPGNTLLSLKAGRYRTPFGISSGSDQGYMGFLRAPLIRYDGYFALSNSFLEQGVDLVAGVPRFTVEASAGSPADVGAARRPSGLDSVVRVQTYVGNLVAGASYIRTLPYQDPRFAHGHAHFTGVDARWAYGGFQLRGEWLSGRPFDNTTTDGWYIDAIVHRIGMGPVTAVARVERLRYDTVHPFDLTATRETVGARIRVLQPLALQVNVCHQTGGAAKYSGQALDIGLTYSIRRP
jgi:hypothetical protein